MIFWRDNGASHYWKYLQARPSLRPRVSAYIQPPVLAYAVLRVFLATADEAFAREMLGSISRFHAWLRRERDPDMDGLISVVSPFESGMDWSPQYDLAFGENAAANVLGLWLAGRFLDLKHMLAGHDSSRMLRRFDVEDVATNSIWYEAQVCLAELASRLGDSEVAQIERQGAELTRQAITTKCWDESCGDFFSLIGPDEKKLKTRTIASLTPLLVDGLTAGQVDALARAVADPARFGAPYGLPSVALDEKSFRKNTQLFTWRGPTWVNMNWFVLRGLLKYDQQAQAKTLASRTAALVQRYGFWECFDPYSGVGMGAPDFSWTTLAVDMEHLTSDIVL